MFLIRTMFWLALVVLLLPTDQQQQARLYTTAVDSVHRAATFCDRNKTFCENGKAAWAVFQKKLEFGARMVFDIASERLAGGTASAEKPIEPAVERGTLTPSDTTPAWRGKHGKTGV